VGRGEFGSGSSSSEIVMTSERGQDLKSTKAIGLLSSSEDDSISSSRTSSFSFDSKKEVFLPKSELK
jgi:hypothetical protein